MAVLARAAAEDKQAENVVGLDVGKLTSLAHYFLIMHGNSDRHVRAIAQNIIDVMHQNKNKITHKGEPTKKTNFSLLRRAFANRKICPLVERKENETAQIRAVFRRRAGAGVVNLNRQQADGDFVCAYGNYLRWNSITGVSRFLHGLEDDCIAVQIKTRRVNGKIIITGG